MTRRPDFFYTSPLFLALVQVLATLCIGIAVIVVAFGNRAETQKSGRVLGYTARTSIQIDCAIDLTKAHPEWAAPGAQPGEQEAFDACVLKGLHAAGLDR